MGRILAGYEADPWFGIPANTSALRLVNGYWLNKENQILVPNQDTLRMDIIKSHHEPQSNGHVGRDRTLDLMRRKFNWRGLKKDVSAFVDSCHQCQTNKANNQRAGGTLQPVEIPEGIWECVSMDLITQLPATRSGYDAIAVFVDKLSKMVHLAPCQTACSAQDFAKLFRHHVQRLHGLPKKLVSDRDPRFTGNFLREVMRLNGVQQALSTAFHPQTDGQTERVNRILEDMLRHYVNPYQDDWDECLDMAEFAINNAKQTSTGVSPFFLNYGVNPRTPLDLDIESKVPLAKTYVSTYLARVKEARTALELAQERQKKYADQSRREVTYEVGQEVLLSTRNIKFKGQGVPKLMPKWVGPFKVKTLIGAKDPQGQVIKEKVRAVELELPPLMKLHPVFHVSLVKEYVSDGQNRTVQPLEFDDDGAPKWEVETLLDQRRTGRGQRVLEYLVRWKGFGPEQDSWEPEKHIHCKTLIEDFERRKAGQDLTPLPRLKNQLRFYGLPGALPGSREVLVSLMDNEFLTHWGG